MRLALTLAVAAAIIGGTGCVMVARPGAAVTLGHVHVHSVSCGHFWGYYGAYPVYFEIGRYSYWSGRGWVILDAPPGHARKHHHPHHHHQRGRVHVTVH